MEEGSRKFLLRFALQAKILKNKVIFLMKRGFYFLTQTFNLIQGGVSVGIAKSMSDTT